MQIQHPDHHEHQERDWTSPSRPDEQRPIEKEMENQSLHEHQHLEIKLEIHNIPSLTCGPLTC